MDSQSSTEYLSYGLDPSLVATGETTRSGTLTRSTWLAQTYEEPKPKDHKPPSHLNLVLAMLSFCLCPFLGWLAIIFAGQARYEYNKGNYNESDALCTRSRGTAFYSIAIGIGLGLGYGVLVGAGLNLGWYN